MSEHIVIGDVRPRIQVVGDGIQTVFFFPFPIFNESDLEVYLDETLTETGFTIFGAGNSEGGYVDFESPPNGGVTITLRRYMRIERTSDFAEGGALHAAVLNKELDYLVSVSQQNADEISRAVLLHPTDGDTALMLPSRQTRANATFAFDANGAPIAGPNADDIAQAQANGEIALQAASAALDAQMAAEAARDAAQVFNPENYRQIGVAISTADLAEGAVTQDKIDPAVMLGGPSLGANSVIRTNADVIAENIIIPAGTNGMSAGPITIAQGYSVTVLGHWSVV